MKNMQKHLHVCLVLSLLLTLGLSFSFADVVTSAMSTNYFQYPNTLSLNLKANAESAQNGVLLKEEKIAGFMQMSQYARFKWLPVYENLLTSVYNSNQVYPDMQWMDDFYYPNRTTFYLYDGSVIDNSKEPKVTFRAIPSADYLPIEDLPSGSRLFCWYDGTWFYLAKDKVNLITFGKGNFSTDGNTILRKYSDPNLTIEGMSKVCADFEAAIAKKNAPMSTDYTKYPNTLSLNLTTGTTGSNENGTRITSTIRNYYMPESSTGGWPLALFNWNASYQPILRSFETSRNFSPMGSLAKVYENGRAYDNLTNTWMDQQPQAYLPVYDITPKLSILQWFNGEWFYLAKDKVNILSLVTDAAVLPSVGGSPSNFDATAVTAICENFEAAIAKKNAPLVTSIPGLAAWYKFDGDLKDASGNGNNGSEVGVVGYTATGALGQGLDLNGGYVKIPGSTSLNLGEQFTLSAWVKMNTEQVEINNYNTILYKENITPDRMDDFHYYTAITGTSDARMELEQRSTGFEPFVGTQGVFPLELHTRWAMVTWVSDGDTLYLYVDGKLNTTGTTGKREYNAPFLDNTTATLYIGGPTVGSLSLFDGQLDEVKLYSRALSGTEIKSDYDAVKGGGSNVIQLWIGQKRLISDAVESVIDSAPLILSGRTLVPVRPIIEAMGGNVTYDQATRRIDLTLKNRTLTLWIDKYEAIVNGQTLALQVAPTVVNGRTMLPLRFAAESLGATVFWEPIAQKITLRYTR